MKKPEFDWLGKDFIRQSSGIPRRLSQLNSPCAPSIFFAPVLKLKNIKFLIRNNDRKNLILPKLNLL